MAVDIGALFAYWGWVASAAFAIMTAFVSSVYAFGSILMNEKIKTWAKMELLEIFYSALVFVLCISSVGIVDAVVQGSFAVSNAGSSPGGPTFAYITDKEAGFPDETYLDICGSTIASSQYSIYHDLQSCHIKLATYYLREIFAEGRDFAYSVYKSYLWTSTFAEASINIETVWEQAGFFTWTPWRGLFQMGNTIKELSFDWAMKINMLTKFQEIIVRLTALALFPALLIVGSVLRTFTFTRKLGGLLLAIAISLYFIYPAFYAFGALVMLDMKEKALPAWEANPMNTHDSHNPPLANTVYVVSDINTFGGTVTNDKLEEDAKKFEDMNSEEFANYVESQQANEGITPNIDLSKKTLSQAEKEQAYDQSQSAFKNWFGGISRMNMIDRLATKIPSGPSYWGANGFIDTLSRLTFFSLFFSLFGILATIAGIRSLAMTFGGDIEIAGLTRLI